MWKYYFALVAALWLFFNTFFRSPWYVWRRGLPVAAALPYSFVRIVLRSHGGCANRRKRLNLTKSKRSRIGFKAG